MKSAESVLLVARDEQQFLGPIFTFYLLAAGVALLATRRFPALWAVAEKDLDVLQNALTQLSKRWPSAIGARKALQNVMDNSDRISTVQTKQLSWLNAGQLLFFEEFSPDLCRLWHPLETYTKAPSGVAEGNMNEENSDMMTAEILGNMRHPAQPNFGNTGAEIANLANFQYDGVGNW